MAYKNKEEQREYQRRWKEARRAEFFKDRACAKCGSTEDLELDHVDESSKDSHRIWSWSEARRLEELAKCQTLCGVCHKEKTAKFLFRPITHGTRSGYNDRGCRCELCSKAAYEYQKRYR